MHAELPAVADRVLRHPACRRRRGAGEPDEQGRRVRPLHHRPRRALCDHQPRPGRHRCTRPTSACRLRSACASCWWCRLADALPEPHATRPKRRPTRCSPGCTREPAAAGRQRAGPTRWRRRMRRARCGPARTTWRVLPYTSGTTGLPKGCMHTHRTLMPNAVGGAVEPCRAGNGGPGRGADVPHHRSGLPACWARSTRAATVVLLPRWDRELAGAADRAPSGFALDLHPDHDHRPARQPAALRVRPVAACATCRAAGRRCRTPWPNACTRDSASTFAEGYGLTETAAPSHGNPPERAKLQCLGMPIFGVDARVVDPETLRATADGRDAARSSPTGRWSSRATGASPRRRQAAFIEIDGKRFFRTGDLGRIDEDGYFFITDRLKRMINASGYKVWPSEVELLLFKCPGVQEACVIAARDDYRGETVKAVVVLRPRRVAGPRPTRHHRLGARTHGGLQGAAHRRTSSTRCPRAARARSCGGCCRSGRTVEHPQA